ncbi:ATPase assembly factor ATP10 [Macleaya cordata]|uniref:ATPase assembly factor ATP10 n=1 Tax=Macleaya cordata TaxID=56857 RepID=A0A200R5C4_MACCD|nr:ATPase assembly factor ATP10 [Macleaya cordata]
MFRLKRLMVLRHPNPMAFEASTVANFIGTSRRRRHEGEEEMLFLPSQRTTYRFLDIFRMGDKAYIEKERARLSDEMSRGYFADMSDLKKHGGKIAMASNTIIPAMEAVKFPSLEVNYSDGTCLNLPATSQENADKPDKMAIPGASLVCLSFRASSQGMIDSWSVPFVDAFSASKNVRIFEVSFIESWFLSLNPIKWLLLRIMRKSKTDGKNDVLQRQLVYSFGDKYYFRKELKILNLLTGYIFLLDRFGRIRWQGFGLATEEELKSLVSCASLLLKEK